MQLLATPQLPFYKQLRWKLTAIFLIVAIVPIVFITTIVLRQVEDQNRRQVFTQLESISVLKRQQIDVWIKNGKDLLNIMVASPQLSTAMRLPIAQPQMNTLFQQISESNATIADIFIYDIDGRIVSSSNETLIDRIVRRQPYFDASLLGEHVQAPYFDVSAGGLVLVSTEPVYQGDTIIGVAAVRYNTDELTDILLERVGLGDSGETYLVSQENNYFLTDSRAEGYPQNRAYRSDGINSALSGENGQDIYTNYQTPAVPVFGSYRWIPELNAALMTEISEDEALDAVNDARGIIIALAILVSALASGAGIFITNRLTRPILHMTSSASKIGQGDFSQRVSVTRDDEIGLLANAFNSMTQAIQDRTSQLQTARDEALAAQRIANENSRLKSEFLSMMSHELRTPMNAIEGFTGIMLKRMAGVDYNDKTERYLHKVQSNSQRLLGLINDFLDLSRIESGRLELAYLPMSPVEMAQKWRDNLSSLADNKHLAFDVNVDTTLPQTIYGDEESLTKIAINLVGNAIKFTEAGSVTLSLIKRDNQMELEVKDTGMGIPAHARDFIFDEFRQVDQSSKRVHGGTGLGLAIVQKLAREMGGTVSVQSQVGAGSTFTVLLPINIEEEPVLYGVG
ncbi:MAG: ATP-binding protein [Aggregatilineales bacterium]